VATTPPSFASHVTYSIDSRNERPLLEGRRYATAEVLYALAEGEMGPTDAVHQLGLKCLLKHQLPKVELSSYAETQPYTSTSLVPGLHPLPFNSEKNVSFWPMSGEAIEFHAAIVLNS